jgi:hypothetical protein
MRPYQLEERREVSTKKPQKRKKARKKEKRKKKAEKKNKGKKRKKKPNLFVHYEVRSHSVPIRRNEGIEFPFAGELYKKIPFVDCVLPVMSC